MSRIIHYGSKDSSAAPAEIVNKTGGVEINGKLYFGLDAEIQLKQQEQFDYKLEKELWRWIAAALDDQSLLSAGDDLAAVLLDGQVLCRLANRVKPNSVKKINAKKGVALMAMENIRHYLAFCWSIGLPSTSLFTSSDLYNRRSITEVLRNLEALARHTQTLDGWTGPPWTGPKLAKRKEGEKSWATLDVVKPVFVQDAEGAAEQIDLRSQLVKLQEKLARVQSERDELTAELEQVRQAPTATLPSPSPPRKSELAELAKLRDEFEALQTKYRAQQETLVKYWDQIRALTQQVDARTAEIDRLRTQVVALAQMAAPEPAELPTPARPQASGGSKLPAAAVARQAQNKDAGAGADPTDRFVAKLRQCVSNLFACRVPVPGKKAPPTVDVDPTEVHRLAKILETELGRRAFATVLQDCTYGDPESPLQNDAFEMLLYFFNTLLQHMDVTEAPDLITASVVLHSSTIIKRLSDSGAPQFVHEFLHQYETFANKRLWVELFWDELLAKMQSDVVSSIEEGHAYVVNNDICRMLLQLSVNRMIMWEASSPLVLSVVNEIVEQLHLTKELQLEMQDTVVRAFHTRTAVVAAPSGKDKDSKGSKIKR